MDRTNLRNMCATLGLSEQAVAGFEQEAYDVMQLLIFYRTCSNPQIRNGLAQQLSTMTRNRAPSGQHSFRSYFASHLNTIRLGAFFHEVDTAALASRSGMVNYPWCLNDREFTVCFQALKSGGTPDSVNYQDPTAAGSAFDSAREAFVTDRIKEAITASAFAIPLIARAATRVVLGSTLLGWAISFGFDFLYAWMKEVARADMLRRYEIDERRRLHAVSLGLSIYSRQR